MFKTIMVPVDLAHVGALEKALSVAAMMARQDGATVTYVGVAANAPSSVAHTPAEFADKLDAFADAQAKAHDIRTAAHPITTHDPATDLDAALLEAAKAMDADCIVAASHIPNLADHLWPSHGGSLARHAHASVFVIR